MHLKDGCFTQRFSTRLRQQAHVVLPIFMVLSGSLSAEQPAIEPAFSSTTSFMRMQSDPPQQRGIPKRREGAGTR